MTLAAPAFEVIEGGSSVNVKSKTDDRTDDPLMTPSFWISAKEISDLSGITHRVVARAVAARRWRGVELLVREVEAGRFGGGRGGKVPQVHVDSLPDDLRADWYAARGIALHEQVDVATGAMVLVPDPALDRDAYDADALKLARWRHDVIRPVLALPRWSRGRGQLIAKLAGTPRLFPDGVRKAVTSRTLHNWVRAYEDDDAGLLGLLPAVRKDKGTKRVTVTTTWDTFFAPYIDGATQAQVADVLIHYIRSLWGSGERGKYAISEKATTRLIELSRDLGVVAFDALPLGQPVSKSVSSTQFGVCFVNTRRVSSERGYEVLAIKRKDNARFQDTHVPHILRDYSSYNPRDIIVGDVHPTDVMLRRADGSAVYPKAISWMDIATNEMHMTFVFLEKGEGVKREHVAMAFEGMVKAWGLPKLLYLDNGAEYKWAEMIGGFTQLSKLTEGAFSIHDDFGTDAQVRERVMGAREAVVRSLAYNAKGKPKIEGAFGNIEQVHFALLPGWTDGDRMSKKTHAKGKDPAAFPGTSDDFLEAASTMLEWYHKRPQRGRLDGKSPNEALRSFVDRGWGKTTLANGDVLSLAFAEEVTRVPKSGRVSYKSRHGDTTYFYADELLTIQHPVTLRVPAYRPEFVFCFDGETFLCIARPERMFGVLDRAGAEELGRRKKVHLREIARLAKHCALLDLVEETARHNRHLADAPEAPVATTVHVKDLEDMARRIDDMKCDEMGPRDPGPVLDQWGVCDPQQSKFIQDETTEGT